jgi:hypothetical protein
MPTIKSYITATFGQIKSLTGKKKNWKIFGFQVKLYDLTTITIFVPAENGWEFISW